SRGATCLPSCSSRGLSSGTAQGGNKTDRDRRASNQLPFVAATLVLPDPQHRPSRPRSHDNLVLGANSVAAARLRPPRNQTADVGSTPPLRFTKSTTYRQNSAKFGLEGEHQPVVPRGRTGMPLGSAKPGLPPSEKMRRV